MSDSQWKEYWASTVGSALVAAELVLWPVLGSGNVTWLVVVGIGLLSTGITFFVLSVLELRRGGETVLNPTSLVDTGIYAIIRHPQYVAWLMFSVALVLIVQSWIVAVAGAASAVLYLVDFRKVDADEGINRFGDAYRAYMERVPGWNPIAGLWRSLRRSTS